MRDWWLVRESAMVGCVNGSVVVVASRRRGVVAAAWFALVADLELSQWRRWWCPQGWMREWWLVRESAIVGCVKMALVLIYPKQKSLSMAPVPLQPRPNFWFVPICLGSKTEAE